MSGRLLALMLCWLAAGYALPAAARPAAGAAAVPAAGMLLVARRELPSPAFRNSVVLITAHDAGGTLGVIVNRRTGFDAADLLPEVRGLRGRGYAVYIGGPVAPHRIVMLLRDEPAAPGIEPVSDQISFAADREVLEALVARDKPARDLRLYAGHAGWAAGQLDAELARGDWHLVPADSAAVFGEDEERLWERFINRLDPPGIRIRAPAPGALAAR